MTSSFACATPIRGARGWTDTQFLALLRAYRAYGGLWRFRDALRMSRASGRDRSSTLDGLFAFEWGEQRWLPAFQFQPLRLAPCERAMMVVAELRPVFDDMDVAHWCIQSSIWLDGAAPVKLMPMRCSDVIQAARIDRFVAAG